MRGVYRYRIGSVTKTFVSTIVLELAAEGKLTLDDRVERWLPGKVPNSGAISLRQLLNHTSGLYDFTKDAHFVESVIADPSHAWTPQQLLDVAFSHAPNFEPGTGWSYSNTGYILLGLVTEAVTGKPFQDVLFERLVGPLNLHSTSLPTSPFEPDPWVHGFVDLGQGDIDISSLLTPTEGWTAGGIVSNASDVTTFLSALLRGRLMPPAFLAQMKSGSAVSGSYGLGLIETSTRCGLAYGHDGDFVGWRNVTLSTASGKRQAVVVVNTGSRVSNLTLQATAKSALCSG
jgi:D-alanyl-D-alanine carboxypeptidase